MKKKALFSFLTVTLLFCGYTEIEANPASANASPKQVTSKKVTSIKPGNKPDKPDKSIQPQWKVFNAPDGRFSILMPGAPKTLSQTQKTFMGEINLQVFVAQPPNQEVAYIVAFNDFPDRYGDLANPKELLENAKDMALKTTQSNLIKQKDIISYNGHPGKEIEYVNQGGKITRNRMYVAQGRLYQVMVIMSKRQQKTLEKTMNGYLNSFQLALKK
jgi:hypothetical protein